MLTDPSEGEPAMKATHSGPKSPQHPHDIPSAPATLAPSHHPDPPQRSSLAAAHSSALSSVDGEAEGTPAEDKDLHERLPELAIDSVPEETTPSLPLASRVVTHVALVRFAPPSLADRLATLKAEVIENFFSIKTLL